MSTRAITRRVNERQGSTQGSSQGRVYADAKVGGRRRNKSQVRSINPWDLWRRWTKARALQGATRMRCLDVSLANAAPSS